MAAPLRCPRCFEPIVPPEWADAPLRCPRCQSEVPPPDAHIAARSFTSALPSPELDPLPNPGVLQCPGCGVALPDQCRTCPNCERVLDTDDGDTWVEQLGEELRGEYTEARFRLRAAALLGGLYICGLIGGGVGTLVSLAAPGAGAPVGFLLFIALLSCFVALIGLLQHGPHYQSMIPPKTRRGIFLILVLAGFVCTLLLVSVVALCGFFFTACTCTGGSIVGP